MAAINFKGMFTADAMKNTFEGTGQIESINDYKLNGTHNLELVRSKGGDKPWPVILAQENGEWKFDLAGEIVFGSPGPAKQISDIVGSLLANPTQSNCKTAVDLLKASAGLADKYDLWLQSSTVKSIVTSDRIKALEDAKAIASTFDALTAKANTALTAAATAPKPVPTWQTVIDVTGSTDQQTQTFSLGSGQKKLLYNLVGDSMSLCMIYLMQAGHSLDQEGGFPIVSPADPGSGETYIRTIPQSAQEDSTSCARVHSRRRHRSA